MLLGRLVEAGINGRMYASGTPMWFPWRAKLINEYLFYISSVFLKVVPFNKTKKMSYWTSLYA